MISIYESGNSLSFDNYGIKYSYPKESVSVEGNSSYVEIKSEGVVVLSVRDVGQVSLPLSSTLEELFSKIADLIKQTGFDSFTDFGSEPRTVIVNKIVDIPINRTIPDNVTLVFESGGGFNVYPGVILTNNDLSQDRYPSFKIYYGTGDVKTNYPLKEGVVASWFGAVSDFNEATKTGTDCSVSLARAIYYAINSKVSNVFLPQGIIYIDKAIGEFLLTAGSSIKIIGDSTTIWAKALPGNDSVTLRVFDFKCTESRVVAINANTMQRSSPLAPESARLYVSGIDDYNWIGVGDVIGIKTFVSSSDPDRNGKIWAYEFSTINQKGSIADIFIPDPVMPIYGTPFTVPGSTDTIITNYTNSSSSSASVIIYKQIDVCIEGIKFVLDYQNVLSNTNTTCVNTEQAVVNMMDCSLYAYPADNIPSETSDPTGVEYGLKRRLLYASKNRNCNIDRCYVENYGYAFWLNNGYQHRISNTRGKKGRHLLASHGITNCTLDTIECSSGGAFDAHGGCGDWILNNIIAYSSKNPASVNPDTENDLNNLRIWQGNVSISNSRLGRTLIGQQAKNDALGYLSAVVDLTVTAYPKLMYDQRIANSSLSVVNSYLKELTGHGRYTKLKNSTINKFLYSEQNLPAASGTTGGLPAYVEIDECYTANGYPLLAACNQSGMRGVIVRSKEPKGYALYKPAGTVMNTIGITSGTSASEVTLARNTIFMVLSPDQVVVKHQNADFYRAITANQPKSLIQVFDLICDLPTNLSVVSQQMTLVFLLGNYGLIGTTSLMKAEVEFDLNCTSSSSYDRNRNWINDKVEFQLAHNYDRVPPMVKNFSALKTDLSGPIITLDAIRTYDRTDNTGNLLCGFPQEIQNWATETQCASLAKAGFEMDITISVQATSPLMKSLNIKGELVCQL